MEPLIQPVAQLLDAGMDLVLGTTSRSGTAIPMSTVVSLLGGRFNEKVLNIINKVCGAVIIFYGCKLLWSFVKLMGWL